MNPNQTHPKKSHSTATPARLQNKNSVFLAHKTIARGGRKKNNFIGKKRKEEISTNSTEDIENKTEEDIESIKKNEKNSNENKIKVCFNCDWKFPDRMSIARRNIHINNCFEGKGKLDIMKYYEEQKIKNYSHLSDKKLLHLVNCPICGKNIQTNNNKTKYNHLSYCIRHLQ